MHTVEAVSERQLSCKTSCVELDSNNQSIGSLSNKHLIIQIVHTLVDSKPVTRNAKRRWKRRPVDAELYRMFLWSCSWQTCFSCSVQIQEVAMITGVVLVRPWLLLYAKYNMRDTACNLNIFFYTQNKYGVNAACETRFSVYPGWYMGWVHEQEKASYHYRVYARTVYVTHQAVLCKCTCLTT